MSSVEAKRSICCTTHVFFFCDWIIFVKFKIKINAELKIQSLADRRRCAPSPSSDALCLCSMSTGDHRRSSLIRCTRWFDRWYRRNPRRGSATLIVTSPLFSRPATLASHHQFLPLHHLSRHQSYVSLSLSTIFWLSWILLTCIGFILISFILLTFHRHYHHPNHHHHNVNSKRPTYELSNEAERNVYIHSDLLSQTKNQLKDVDDKYSDSKLFSISSSDSIDDNKFRLLTTFFRFTLNPGTASCSAKTHLLVLIHSQACHESARDDLRHTWAVARQNIRIIFLLGQPSLSSSSDFVCDQSSLQREFDRHHDLVQGKFIDSYRNLTLKHLMGLYWATRHCSQASVILKSDDDTFIDLNELLRMWRHELIPTIGQSRLLTSSIDIVQSPTHNVWINSVYTNLDHQLTSIQRLNRTQWIRLRMYLDRQMRSISRSDAITSIQGHIPVMACSMFPNGTRTRRTGKWALTRQEHYSDQLPPYCSGLAYALNPAAARLLLQSAATYNGSWLHIDDLFVTGILLQHALKSMSASEQLALFDWSSRYSYNWRTLQSWTLNRARSLLPPLVTDLGDCPHRAALMSSAAFRLLSLNFV